VNDIVFFEEDNMANVLIITNILRCFEMVSGLKVNFFRSKFGALGGVDSLSVERCANMLNCKLPSFPLSYWC